MTTSQATSMQEQRLYRLSPSDFSFGWNDCRRCLYLKYVLGLKRPSGPFPSIFGTIDRAMRARYAGVKIAADGLPALSEANPAVGARDTHERRVESAPFTDPDYPAVALVVAGKLDCLVLLDAGGVIVEDFKTSAVKADYRPLYGRQLGMYGWALAHPAKGEGVEIATTRLVVYEPTSYEDEPGGARKLVGRESICDLGYDARQLIEFFRAVMALFSGPVPLAPPTCGFCEWDAMVATKAREKDARAEGASSPWAA